MDDVNYDDGINEEDDEGFVDYTKVTTQSVKKLKTTTDNHVLGYFRKLFKSENPQYKRLEDLPEDYDFEKCLDEYSDYGVHQSQMLGGS